MQDGLINFRVTKRQRSSKKERKVYFSSV